MRIIITLVIIMFSAGFALAGGNTAFNYQGRLLEAGVPANGTFNVDFSLWDDPVAGSQIGSTIIFNSLPISDGLFTVELDFGASAFDNTSRWIEIAVNGSTLNPRQLISRSPYSIQTRGIFVDANNNVGIGITEPLFNKFEVVNYEDSHAIRGTATVSGRVGVWGHGSAKFSFGVVGSCAFSSGYDFFANGAGQNYGSASSRRWKSNIVNIDDPLGKLARIRGVYYDWDAEHGGHHDIGMIAEEVGEVLPEIVNYEKNGIDAIGMDYSKLTPLLVEAVNELHREVEHKDLQIMELQDRLNALEALIDQFVLQNQGGAK